MKANVMVDSETASFTFAYMLLGLSGDDFVFTNVDILFAKYTVVVKTIFS